MTADSIPTPPSDDGGAVGTRAAEGLSADPIPEIRAYFMEEWNDNGGEVYVAKVPPSTRSTLKTAGTEAGAGPGGG